jgi:hypothetical protein
MRCLTIYLEGLAGLDTSFPSSKEIQPIVGGKENTLVVMANQLLPNLSIGETITPSRI